LFTKIGIMIFGQVTMLKKNGRCDKTWSIIGKELEEEFEGAFEHEQMVDDYQLEPILPCWDTLISCPTFDK
jgi:hypothetical protein